MEQEIMLNVNEILVQKGSIIFNDFERIRQQALRLSEFVKAVEVDENNIKQSKKMLAAINGRVKELEDKRISIKKTMLEPYADFENQVKEIVAIVKEADTEVRDQVKKLEEFERMAKKDTLIEIFKKRLKHYSFRDLFSFEDFLQPKHLNKTTSIESVEKEMVEFLEGIGKDIKVINTMTGAEDILSGYIETKDLAAAITLYNEKEQRRAQIEASQALKKQPNLIAFLVNVKCHDQKELKFLEYLLKENGFEYSIDQIERKKN